MSKNAATVSCHGVTERPVDDYCSQAAGNGGAENAGVEKAGVENAGAITDGKP